LTESDDVREPARYDDSEHSEATDFHDQCGVRNDRQGGLEETNRTERQKPDKICNDKTPKQSKWHAKSYGRARNSVFFIPPRTLTIQEPDKYC
jgi:hypothetical protein